MAGVWKFKAVKAKKLRQSEFKRKIRNAVVRVGRGVKRDFEKTTQTWSDRPKFILTYTIGTQDNHPGFGVGTDDETYNLVNEGSPPHPIYPVNAQKLRFQEDYTAKTQPGVVGSRVGGKSGDVVFADQVEHPGFEGRKFDEQIATEWEGRFRKAIEGAIRSGVKSSGHAK